MVLKEGRGLGVQPNSEDEKNHRKKERDKRTEPIAKGESTRGKMTRGWPKRGKKAIDGRRQVRKMTAT